MKSIFNYKWLLCTLLIWAVIFAVPSFRYHLNVMANGSPWIRFTVIPNNYWKYRFNDKEPKLPIKIAAIKQGGTIYGSSNNLNLLNPIDEIVHQHPDVPWLIATRLQMTLGAFSGNRQGGEWSEANISEDIKKGIPPVEKRSRNVNFTPKQLAETLVLCRRGEKIEPQNAYFTWMRFYFLMLSWQDTKARKALSEAASKSYWNNHEKDFERLYVKAASNILGRPLTPYEKINLDALLFQPMTGGRTREMGRIIGWEGVKLKRAGKHDEALQLWADEYHTMTLAAQSQSKLIAFLVDYAMLSMAATGATYPSRESFRNEPQKEIRLKKRMQGLIAYAKKYHRLDLARQFERDWQKNYSLFRKLKTSNLLSQSSDMLSLMEMGGILLNFSVLLILSIIGALLTWLILECYRIFARRKSTFEENANTITFWGRCKGVFACSGLPSLLLAMGFLLLLTYIITLTIPQDQQYDLFGGWGISSIFFSIPSDSTLLGRMLEIFGNSASLGSLPVLYRLMVFLTPIISGAIFVLFQSSKNANLLNSIWFRVRKWVYLALLFAAWGIPVLTTDYETTQVILTTICVVFLIVSFIWMWRKSRKRSVFKLSLMQSSLSGWVFIGSFLVLMLIFGQIALDKKIQPWANNQLHGEMHLLHYVVDSPPNPQ